MISILFVILNRIRVFTLRSKGAKVGANLKIYGRIRIQGNHRKLSIGDNCTLNDGVFLGTRGGLTIGNNVRISPHVVVLSSGLNVDKDKRQHFEKETIIENNVWIASNATITAGVRIGSNSVVGAGAVVTRDIPPSKLAVGVPARAVKDI